MTKGRIIADLIAFAFKGDCGPFGGEDPYLNDNEVGLHSQMGTSYYSFTDTGAVNIDFDREAAENLKHEGIDVYTDIQCHWDNILDFLQSDDGWFMEFVYDNPIIVELIKKVLEL